MLDRSMRNAIATEIMKSNQKMQADTTKDNQMDTPQEVQKSLNGESENYMSYVEGPLNSVVLIVTYSFKG